MPFESSLPVDLAGMTVPTMDTGNVIANGLETYEILEKISGGEGRAVIYKVACKSGRLRNRHLALKKAPSLAKSEQPSWISLHQALHHPNIVSLLSVFSTLQETIYVLELCSAGNLAQFLQSRSDHALSEPELRGVCKSLVDALSYLRKESVIHRDINPSNILLTSAYGIKLSGFKNAICLTKKHITAYPLSGPLQDYIAPEILSGRPHGFPVDVWSLGCVMVYCLAGSMASGTYQTPLRDPGKPNFRLPEGHASDARSLISSLVQFIPENRIHLPDIMSHTFFANGRVITSLSLSSTRMNAELVSQNVPNQPHNSVKLPSFQHNRANRRSIRHASDDSLHSFRDKTRLGPAELNSGDAIYNMPTHANAPLSSKFTRRVVSDPVCELRKWLQSESLDINTKLFTAGLNRTMPVLKTHKGLDLPFIASSIPSPQSKLSEATHVDRDDSPSAEYSQSKKGAAKLRAQEDQMTTSQVTKLPIGTGRPSAFSTADLACQTHKIAHGQLTVLASHSLLVDFRESQRRNGMKGNEVLVIGPDGNKIAVYSAPHLSSPCCLIEPTREFSIHTLPQIYWKQYNDASRLVDQIKRRTPKVVLHSVRVKCTLMANTPQGDIEVLLKDPIASSSVTDKDRSLSVRVCFSRQDKSVEFARYNLGVQGEEWVKKAIPLITGPPYISAKHLEDLTHEEKSAMQHLIHFARVCETLEELMPVDKAPDRAEQTSPLVYQGVKAGSPTAEHDSQLENVSTTRSTYGISLPNIGPRPTKISIVTDTLGTDGSQVDKTLNEQKTDRNKAFSKINSVWREDLNQAVTGQGVQSRFIPSVGWCVRHPSRVSQGGRYKMMFLDGAALDIDVDEEWVGFKDTGGETTVYDIQDCRTKRKIGDRMKIFEDFVSLFDDSQED